MTQATNELKLEPTSVKHVFYADVDDSGLLKEIVLVKKFRDGTLYYIPVDGLHPIDKSRLAKILKSQHADKYECWELLSQARLSNGVNALDFFHANNVKIKRPRGAKAVQGQSLADTPSYGGSDKMIGSEFVNPAEASMDTASRVFQR
jgi:hypothetical protein